MKILPLFLFAASVAMAQVPHGAGKFSLTNQFAEISGFSRITGFTAARDGDVREVRLSGAESYTIANDVKFAPPGSRIVTGTGGNVVLTNQPAFARFRYRGLSGRWELVGYSR